MSLEVLEKIITSEQHLPTSHICSGVGASTQNDVMMAH